MSGHKMIRTLAALLFAAGAAHALVPAPASMVAGDGKASIGNYAYQTAGGAAVPTLEAAYDRFAALQFRQSGVAEPTPVTVTVADADEAPPQLGTDESYSLAMPADGSAVNITANTVYGALHALETLSQLTHYDFDAAAYVVTGLPVQIDDEPRYGHRGLLIDSVRHYLSLPTLYRLVDSMAMAKLNVLHWHLADTEAFTLQTDAYPELWTTAIDATARFTRDDARALVEYARLRGVRVMPEFDMPGHGEAICTPYPEVCPDPPSVLTPLDPTTNASFALVEGVLGDLAALFPDGFIHQGGDEVLFHHWAETPHIAEWMADNQLTLNDTYLMFVQAGVDAALAAGKTPVGWIEIFDNLGARAPAELVAEVWKAKDSLDQVVAMGYRAILADFDQWYLSQVDITLEQVYTNEPTEGISDPAQQALILGGEGCVWGENVDASDLEETVWPRAAAVAERLWSPKEQDDFDEALPRLAAFRCLLNLRGHSAGLTYIDEARTVPEGPGSCFAQ